MKVYIVLRNCRRGFTPRPSKWPTAIGLSGYAIDDIDLPGVNDEGFQIDDLPQHLRFIRLSPKGMTKGNP